MKTDDDPKEIKFTLEGINQRDIDAVNNRLASMKKRLREDILFIGGRLAKMRDKKVPYGSWTSFIQRTFPLSVKTANIWIRAWEGRDTELAVNDWEGYMRALYGNEPKKLKASSKKSLQEDNDDDDEDLKQHGGEGFAPSFFPDKGKPGFLGFKNLVAVLEAEFFGSKNVTQEAKLEFVDQLIKWLKDRREKL